MMCEEGKWGVRRVYGVCVIPGYSTTLWTPRQQRPVERTMRKLRMTMGRMVMKGN